MAKPEYHGYEQTTYGDEDASPYRKFATIKQIVSELVSDHPNCGIVCALQGSELKLSYHTYEMHAPTKMKQIEDQARTALNECVKFLKKEYKARMKEALVLKELKEKANYAISKVSLNERYYYVAWRLYELG